MLPVLLRDSGSIDARFGAVDRDGNHGFSVVRLDVFLAHALSVSCCVVNVLFVATKVGKNEIDPSSGR